MPDLKDMGVADDYGNEVPESDRIVRYPGVYLMDEHVKMLGLDKAALGDEVMLVAVARVSGGSQREEKDGDKRYTVDLDLRSAATGPVPSQKSSDSDLAKRLFGGGDQ